MLCNLARFGPSEAGRSHPQYPVTFTGVVEVVRTPPDDKIKHIKSFQNLSKFDIFKLCEKTAIGFMFVSGL